jgi:hypothetical protein
LVICKHLNTGWAAIQTCVRQEKAAPVLELGTARGRGVWGRKSLGMHPVCSDVALQTREEAGSIPDDVIRSFDIHNSSDRTMVLGSIQPLTEMSTKSIFTGVKSGRWVGLTTLTLSCVDSLEIWEPQTPGLLWHSNMSVQG